MSAVDSARDSVRRAPLRMAEISGVGRAVRARRLVLALSQRELAERIDVSPSLLSQIESGRAQPSVRTLHAIVRELELSLDPLLAGEGRAAHPPAVRWSPLERWEVPSAGFSIATYPPGTVGEHPGADGCCVFGVVLSGSLHVAVGTDEHVLTPGDAVTVLPQSAIRVDNRGGAPARLMWMAINPNDRRSSR